MSGSPRKDRAYSAHKPLIIQIRLKARLMDKVTLYRKKLALNYLSEKLTKFPKEGTVDLDKIRTEDRIDEAKIHEPRPLHMRGVGDKNFVENDESHAKSQIMSPFQGDGETYREG